MTSGKNDDTSAKKSTQGPFLKLTEILKVFEIQGLKFKRPLSAGTVYIFKPKNNYKNEKLFFYPLLFKTLLSNTYIVYLWFYLSEIS
jgi:hypothetical protein